RARPEYRRGLKSNTPASRWWTWREARVSPSRRGLKSSSTVRPPVRLKSWIRRNDRHTLYTCGRVELLKYILSYEDGSHGHESNRFRSPKVPAARRHLQQRPHSLQADAPDRTSRA